MHPRTLLTAGLGVLLLFGGCAKAKPSHNQGAPLESPWLRQVRQIFALVPETLARNYKTFAGPQGPVSGFGAGDVYPQIWLRDSAWIVDAAAAYYPSASLTSWLDLHLTMSEKRGRLRDWVAPGTAEAFREWAPRAGQSAGIAFDTNSNESDQESSAALALCRMERSEFLEVEADEGARNARVSRVIAAMDALARDRTEKKTGLIWSGLTADWGDVSPLYPDQRAIYLDAHTPRTLSLYANVMAYAALQCLSTLEGPKGRRKALAERALKIKEQVRSLFWMPDRGTFRIRRTLDKAPKGFEDDGQRFALGGNALAVLFGVADDAQAASVFEAAESLRVLHKFSTISTVLIPPYAAGVFQHPIMREPFEYQNGGQWDWFGAALIQAEFERGYSERARLHLGQMAARILAKGGNLHEWYAQDGSPKGSPAYAASAAAIHNVVVKGLLGVSASAGGLRMILRAGETMLPFPVPLPVAMGQLVVSQAVSSSAIEVRVNSSAPFKLKEVCSVLPSGSSPADATGHDPGTPQSVRRIGNDTLVCADLSGPATRGPGPLQIRFGVKASSPRVMARGMD